MHLHWIQLAGFVSAATLTSLKFNNARGSIAPEDVNLTVTGSGTGCPSAETLTARLSADNNAIIVDFSAFKPTWNGPDTSPSEASTNCVVDYYVQTPEGYQFSVESTTWTGWAKLDEGVQLRLNNAAYFEGGDSSGINQVVLTGGEEWASGQEFSETRPMDTEYLGYSACGTEGTIQISSRAMIRADFPEGTGTTDGGDVPLTLQLALVWKACGQ